MKPYYLLDTNIISEQFKKNPNKNVMKKLNELSSFCAISTITWHELNYGYNKMVESKRKDDLRKFLSYYVDEAFEKVFYDDHAALIHADFRTLLENKGISKPFADSQIAAIAISNNMILVTRNVDDFKDIPMLMVENWFE